MIGRDSYEEKSFIDGIRIFSGNVLTECSLFETANGIILYGDEEKVLSSLQEEHKRQVEKDSFSVKIIEADDKRTLIMDEATAKELVEKELLKGVEGDDAKAITKLPKISQGEGVLFTKTPDDANGLEGLELATKYEGNIIIGDGRVYGDRFLVVTADDFQRIEVTGKAFGVVQYKKD